MYKVLFTRKSERELDRLAKRDAKNLLKKLSKLTYPLPSNLNIRKITRVKGFYRLRIGNIRVLFEVDFKRKEIWIRKVGYRGGFYRKL